VSASAGYGKSAALAAYASLNGAPPIWYTLDERCDDPLVFLVHLVHACRSSSNARPPTTGDRRKAPEPSPVDEPKASYRRSPVVGQRALSMLERGGSGEPAWSQALDSLVNDLVQALNHETLLILDDYQVVDDSPGVRALIERLIAVRPPLLHVVLSTRRWPQLTCIPTLQVRGELLEIGERDLAFTDEEIEQLFSTAYGHDLHPGEGQEISEQTGGWAIALQLVWQSGVPSGAGSLNAKQNRLGAGKDQQESMSSSSVAKDLFDYLAREVLARQPAEIVSFLLRSSVLSELSPAACDRVLGATDSAAQLEELYRRGLFLTTLGGGIYRYHPLFHSFLQERAAATLPEWGALHIRAADFYRVNGDTAHLLYHLLAIGDVSGAALEIERWAPEWLAGGRLVTLLAWIDELSPEVITAHPQLLIARGDANRLLARFEAAEQAYEQALHVYERNGDREGQAQALRGQALVYVDTVQPARAEALLRQAFKLSTQEPGQPAHAMRSELVGLIAENRLNRGRADQALRILKKYQVPSTNSANSDEAHSALGTRYSVLDRALLRLGRLAEARARLEAELPRDRRSLSLGRPAEAHREITVLLSLIAAMEGDAAAALSYAEEGLAVARRLGSALFEAVARIRLGHALQLARPQDYREANEHYLQAMALADSFHVQRTKAEAFMGLCLLHGFRGDVGAAEEAAREGLTIAEQSGDEWIAAHLWTSMGAIAIANGASGGAERFDEALKRYRTGKDTYGQAVAQLWSSIRHYRNGEVERAARCAIEAFELAQRHGYQGLLTSPTIFGPRDRMMLVPVLLAAREQQTWSSAAQSLLNRAFPAIAADSTTQTYHPGVTLRIRALGPLRGWRGAEEIKSHEWQRKKAREMLALLLTNRHRWLLREQICAWLWPEESTPEAEAQFKVTLNGLNAVLEPLRMPRTPPFYIRRLGGAYRFYPPDGVELDVDTFEALLAEARERREVIGEEESAIARAVEVYGGEYLSEWLYEDWTRDERERLGIRYMEAATLLAESLAGKNRLPEAIRLCELVLARDPGWEDAYCVLMRAYAQQGQRRLALATYERCVRNLREYLDVEPLPTTVRIYEEVKAWDESSLRSSTGDR
jgi:ATP/maltotriose-dependent transcriptional regulator MalT/two-component SAPR family response regulator